MLKVKFRGCNCYISFGWYAGNHRHSISLYDVENHECVVVASVNVIDAAIDEKQNVLIKDWCENEGVLACLIEHNIVEDLGISHPTGFCAAFECKLLVNPEDHE